MKTPSRVQALAERHFEDTVTIRRRIHRRPELSFEERETADFIAQQLRTWKIAFRSPIGGHGIVAEVPGRASGPTVALRADIDALPITEATGLPFASERAGVMHACGHDAHTACLLTAVRILSQLSEQLNGTVRALFQPAEEKLPGGAGAMIRDGALANPQPRVAIGQHINPTLPTGSIGIRAGAFMASVDDLYLTVHGVGGHAAMPDQLIDPVLIASHVVVALQQIVSRGSSPEIPTVLSVGRVIADGATNVIPPLVEMAGTLRTVDEKWRATAHELIRRTARKTAEALGGSCTVRIVEGYPVLWNDEALSERVGAYAAEYIGRKNVQQLPLTMGGEDFAYYGQLIPACFYNLGVCAPGKAGNPDHLHSPRLDLDEAALQIGSGLLAWTAIRELQAAE
ncbi:MAG: amidohydrolase [Spirochaetaceae bacterium]|nr:MAG: amidohydrolase [Spirochaetaceae bacterium]